MDGNGGADGDVNVYWCSDEDEDVGECVGDGVEQEPELEHDVSRSTR